MFIGPLRFLIRFIEAEENVIEHESVASEIKANGAYSNISRSGKGESKTIFKIRTFIASQSDLMLSFHIPGALGQMFAQFRSHQHKELNLPKKEFFQIKFSDVSYRVT